MSLEKKNHKGSDFDLHKDTKHILFNWLYIITDFQTWKTAIKKCLA